jgi:ribose 5-phosphate isomerase A
MSTTQPANAITALKHAAATRALDYVKDGMTLGLGSGSTAEVFLDLLAARVRAGLKIVGTPTSERTSDKAEALGIPLKDLDSLAPLDLVVDGADEADANLISSRVAAARCCARRSSQPPLSAWW